MTDSRTRTQVLCDLVCKLLKEVQDEVSAALGAAE